VKLNDDFLAQMREATQLLQSAGPAAATAAIQRALNGGTVRDAGAAPSGFAPQPEVIDINEVSPRADKASDSAKDLLARFRKATGKKWQGASARQPIEDVEPAVADKGKFLSASCTNSAGTRAYKIYVPSGYQGQALPLVVMLHGCKQNPDDFAAGTGMNAIADENNCFVVYPGQMHGANGSNCWNWFQQGDQQRDKGEPSIIADITREVMREYRIDPNRVYIAGLSAGGAMAAIMGTRYPDLYAAVGIHSGLPVGVAHDVPSAFVAMGNGLGAAGPLKPKMKKAASQQPVPVIVFHGDRDTTVHPRNGDQCAEDFVAAHAVQKQDCDVKVETGTAPNGRSYTRTIRRGGDGKAIAEQWVVHGAGHAWAGGSRRGSFTDPSGPNASKEMMRFFLLHARAAR
jgi:poly(hydroxyalkanoate) depolymerase family esterase